MTRVSTIFAAWFYGLTARERRWLERDPTYRASDNTVCIPARIEELEGKA